MTPHEFHDQLHVDVGKPMHEIRTSQVGKWVVKQKVGEGRAHRAEWAASHVHLQSRDIKVRVNLNLKRNRLSQNDYVRLTNLVFKGIRRHWSRSIRVAKETFEVDVNSVHASGNAVDVDLHIEAGATYARSHNMGILGIDASFIYNAGYFASNIDADSDFMQTAAHEFGHSVLMDFGGLPHSWKHKGSTSLFQSTTAQTMGYPSRGEIDLMKYYDARKGAAPEWRISANTRASELDVKCLLWMSKMSF